MRIDVTKLQELLGLKDILPPRDGGLSIEEICINVFGVNHSPTPVEKEYIGLFVAIVNEGGYSEANEVIKEIERRGSKLSLSCDMAKFIDEQNDNIYAQKIALKELEEKYNTDNVKMFSLDNFISVYDRKNDLKIMNNVIAKSRLERDVLEIEHNVTIKKYIRQISEGEIKQPVLFSKFMMNELYEEAENIDIGINYQVKNPRLKKCFDLIEKYLVKFENFQKNGYSFEEAYAMFIHYLHQENFNEKEILDNAAKEGDEDEVSINYEGMYEEQSKFFISEGSHDFDQFDLDNHLDSEVNVAESQYEKVENINNFDEVIDINLNTQVENKNKNGQPWLTEDKKEEFSIISQNSDLSFVSSQSSKVKAKRRKWLNKGKTNKNDISFRISTKNAKDINLSFNKSRNEILIKIKK